VYLCFEVKESQLQSALVGAKAFGCAGLNVTIPYKVKVIPYLDKIEEEASLIGAVNTIRIIKGKLQGFNTDGEGFILSLKKHKFTSYNKNIMILGAGGAAKALSVYLARSKAKTITYYDIVHIRAQTLAKRINEFFPALATKALRRKDDICLKEVDLLINATGIGLKPSDPLPLKLNNFSPTLVVYDLVYNPLLSKFLKNAQAKGLKVISGLWMLTYQALRAQEIWQQKHLKVSAQGIYNYLVSTLKR